MAEDKKPDPKGKTPDTTEKSLPYISVNTLSGAISTGEGPASAAHYRVVFSLPGNLNKYVLGKDKMNADNLAILCQSVSLPGRQVATTDLSIYGPAIKIPYALRHVDLTVTFLCTNTMAQRLLFEEWQRMVVDPTTNYANYYDSYIGDIFVQKLSEEDRASYMVVYEEAFPVAIFEQPLGDAQREWLQITVQFSYRRWRTTRDIEIGQKVSYEYLNGKPQDLVIPPPPGTGGTAPDGTPYIDPNDIFKGAPVPKVPKFEP